MHKLTGKSLVAQMVVDVSSHGAAPSARAYAKQFVRRQERRQERVLAVSAMIEAIDLVQKNQHAHAFNHKASVTDITAYRDVLVTRRKPGHKATHEVLRIAA